MDRSHALLLMRYNAWANARLHGALGDLAEEEITRPRPSFFGSILKTLNHLMVGDRMWFSRLTGKACPHTQLDEVPYPEFSRLSIARREQDQAMVAWAEQVDPAFVAEAILDYRNSRGEACTTPVALVVTHMVNHGTHHRGQVHDMLSQTDLAPPSLDLIYFLREQ